MIELEDADIGHIMDEVVHDGYFKHSRIECILLVRDRFNMTEKDSIKAINVLRDLGAKDSTAITNTDIIEFHGMRRYCLEFDNTICTFGRNLTIFESPLDYAVQEGRLYAEWKNGLVKHTIENSVLLKIRQYYDKLNQSSHMITIN